jgi:outer membrane lipoprotein-sorting protein
MKTKLILLTIWAIASVGYAQNPQEKGLEIAKKADQVDQGFGSTTTALTMILTNKQGQESKRFMENRTLELVADGDKSLIVFKSPKDVEGTATLTFTHKEGADDQWLYLPAIKRVKRISSSNKSGPFMCSEFAYEDLSSQEVEKYTYSFIKEDEANGSASLVVERIPLDEKSGYTRQLVWYNKSNYRVEKVEYYDRKNQLLKTLVQTDYNLYLDSYWRAGELAMENHQTGKRTKLLFEDYAFQTGLEESDFTQNGLMRAGQ